MPSSSQFSLSFKYPTGVARDLWVATSDSWVGVAVGFQRDHLREAANEPTSMPDAKRYLNSTGIYILRGKDPITGSTLIYVGKGSRVFPRLDNHDRERDWWTEAIAIVSENDKWDSSQAGFFEARLYDLAKKARRCALKNRQEPQGDDLQDHKIGVAENLLEDIVRRLPALGYPEFVSSDETKTGRKRSGSALRNTSTQPSSSPASASTTTSSKTRSTAASARSATWDCPPEAEFRFSGKRYHACARSLPAGKFEVLAGSRASLEVSPSCPPSILARRDALLRSGDVEQTDSHLLFKRPVQFNSASGAAGVVSGFVIGGKKAWRTRDGTLLGDV